MNNYNKESFFDLTENNYMLDSSISEGANLNHFKKLKKSILSDGILSRKDKEIILIAINALRRYEQGMLYHTRCALDYGAKVEELIEVFEACIISRGVSIWMEGRKALLFAKEYKGIKDEDVQLYEQKPIEFDTIEDCKAYLKEENIELPEWVLLMEKYNEDALMNYAQLRINTLRDNLVSKKFKELVIIGLNASESHIHGLKVHINVASKLGATKAEISEVLLTTLLYTGGPAWIEGSKFLEIESDIN